MAPYWEPNTVSLTFKKNDVLQCSANFIHIQAKEHFFPNQSLSFDKFHWISKCHLFNRKEQETVPPRKLLSTFWRVKVGLHRCLTFLFKSWSFELMYLKLDLQHKPEMKVGSCTFSSSLSTCLKPDGLLTRLRLGASSLSFPLSCL